MLNFTLNFEYLIFFLESISTEIDFWPKDYRVGSTIHLDCLVRSQRTGQIIPSADVIWYVNSDIPLSVDETNHHHYMIMPNNTLLIHRLARGDSGVYRCRATTGPISDSYSSIQLQVESNHLVWNTYRIFVILIIQII